MASVATYQYYRCIVISVSCIDVNAFGNLLLTDFEVTPPARLAQRMESLRGVQGIVFFDSPRGNVPLLFVQSAFNLELLHDHGGPLG